MTRTWLELPEAAGLAARRRARLAERLRARRLEGALISDAREVLYFTGAPLAAPAPACLLITLGRSEGAAPRSMLTCGKSDQAHHVDETRVYDWHTGGTVHADLVSSMVACAMPDSESAPARIGVQLESIPAVLMRALSGAGAGATGIDADIADLQRDKDGLELEAISAAVTADRAALAAARDVIAPGASEIEVYAAACRAATLAAGRPVHHDGDYRCGAPGGPARDRRIREDELYIVDAWTRRDGYWADLARTFGVSTRPTALQSDLIAHVAGVHDRVRPMLQPGTPCRELWIAIDAALREFAPLAATGLTHHGGHGIGLRLHEPPDIRRDSPESLRVGDVVCIEPGGYFAGAQAGARVEHMYRITERGPLCLSADGSEDEIGRGR